MDWQSTREGLYYTTMNHRNIKRLHRITALILVATIVFYLFFQINKRTPFVNANPFAVDPYDAVGSIAIQVALLTGLLTYSRVLRWRDDPTQAGKARLILHGNILALATIFTTLSADTLAEILQPMPASIWGYLLRIELAGMFLLTFACGFALWIAFRGVPTVAPPANLTPADAIDDLWSLVRVPVSKASDIFPSRLVGWIKSFNSDWLFKHTPWIDPRQHPWRFASIMGLLAGVLLIMGQLQEGLPPSFAAGLLLAVIYISVELVAILTGFALFGGYLGLRPGFRRKDG
jgi:hypothetical protein